MSLGEDNTLQFSTIRRCLNLIAAYIMGEQSSRNKMEVCKIVRRRMDVAATATLPGYSEHNTHTHIHRERECGPAASRIP